MHAGVHARTHALQLALPACMHAAASIDASSGPKLYHTHTLCTHPAGIGCHPIWPGCRFLNSIGMSQTKILAKLESRQSLLNFQGILNEADGVIISRGNLGLDCVPEKMALVQKTLVQVRWGGPGAQQRTGAGVL